MVVPPVGSVLVVAVVRVIVIWTVMRVLGVEGLQSKLTFVAEKGVQSGLDGLPSMVCIQQFGRHVGCHNPVTPQLSLSPFLRGMNDISVESLSIGFRVESGVERSFNLVGPILVGDKVRGAIKGENFLRAAAHPRNHKPLHAHYFYRSSVARRGGDALVASLDGASHFVHPRATVVSVTAFNKTRSSVSVDVDLKALISHVLVDAFSCIPFAEVNASVV